MAAEGKNMSAQQRRKAIRDILSDTREAVSASALAARLGVSRQIVVGDVALLRASGEQIIATPRGYLMEGAGKKEALVRTIACRHDLGEAMAQELYAVVDNGGEVLDVIVEHPVYGQISGSLKLRSRYDVQVFLDKVDQYRAQPLAALTGGIHLHTVSCESEEAFERIMKALSEQGILLDR